MPKAVASLVQRARGDRAQSLVRQLAGPITVTFVVLFSFAAKRAALITMLPLSLRRVMGKMWHACTMVQQGLLPGALQSSRLGPLALCTLIPTSTVFWIPESVGHMSRVRLLVTITIRGAWSRNTAHGGCASGLNIFESACVRARAILDLLATWK